MYNMYQERTCILLENIIIAGIIHTNRIYHCRIVMTNSCFSNLDYWLAGKNPGCKTDR